MSSNINKNNVVITNDLITEKFDDGIIFTCKIIDDNLMLSTGMTTCYRYELSVNKKPHIISLASEVYEPKFLLGLYNYFRGIILFLYKNSEDHNNFMRSSLNTYKVNGLVPNMPIVAANMTLRDAIGSKQEHLNNFLNNHKNEDFTQEMIAEHLINRSEIIISAEDKKRILSQHSRMFKNIEEEIKNYKDFCRYTVPFLIDYTDNEINFINNFYNRRKKIEYKDLKLYYKLFTLHHNHNKDDLDFNMLIKDYVPDMEYDYGVNDFYNFKHSVVSPDNTNFITTATNGHILFLTRDNDYISNPKIIEIINNLTIAEYNKIYSMMDLRDSTDEIIKLINYSLSVADNKNNNIEIDQKRIDNIYNIVENHYKDVIENLEEKINTDSDLDDDKMTIYKNEVKSYTAIRDKILIIDLPTCENNALYNSAFRTIVEFFDQFNDDDNDKFYMFLRILRNENYVWLSSENDCSSFLVLGELLKKMNGYEIVNLLLDVMYYNQPLTIEQWEKYIADCEDYKDLPVSWWLELL